MSFRICQFFSLSILYRINRKFVCCRYDDGMVEVMALYSSFHIAQLQVGMASPLTLGQARNVKVSQLFTFTLMKIIFHFSLWLFLFIKKNILHVFDTWQKSTCDVHLLLLLKKTSRCSCIILQARVTRSFYKNGIYMQQWTDNYILTQIVHIVSVKFRLMSV
jgi:hypothetical protein